MPIKTIFVVAWAVAFMSSSQLASAEQEVKTIETRPGITMRLLLNAPGSPPKGVLIMFPGGEGANYFWVREGRIHFVLISCLSSSTRRC
jgi:hypothetical protein